ncbi:MAG: sulfurtransferase TusA family protein [Deltaproteobacteria bacterium]|nr:MAG: sulfurtransferase TusA family protein [Deltaproteobacteria bacterium]
MTTKTIELDIRGQVCPSCLLLTLREINTHHADLSAGRLSLVVLTDSRDATGTIPAAAKNMGLAAQLDKVEEYYRVIIARPEERL